MTDGACFYKNDNRCGSCKKIREDKIYLVKELHTNCTNHLVNLKLLKDYEQDPGITEKKLIENRSSNRLADSHSICSFHRYSYGIYVYI